MNREIPFGDPVTLAGAAAVTGGALAVVDPFFRGMTEAAAALAMVAWLPRSLERGARPGSNPSSQRVVGALSSMAAGAVLFFELPGPLDRLGGLALGVSALALVVWVPSSPATERR